MTGSSGSARLAHRRRPTPNDDDSPIQCWIKLAGPTSRSEHLTIADEFIPSPCSSEGVVACTRLTLLCASSHDLGGMNWEGPPMY
jgi:hypothetical protein